MQLVKDIREVFELDLKVFYRNLKIDTGECDSQLVGYYTNEDNPHLFYLLEKYNLYFASSAIDWNGNDMSFVFWDMLQWHRGEERQ